MTFYLHNVEIVIDTLEVLKRHNGKHVTRIAKDEGFQPLVGRINELISKGLAIRPGACGNNPVFITKKGLEVLDMLKKVQARIEDGNGSDEYFYTNRKGSE